jgi:hypothetical protein
MMNVLAGTASVPDHVRCDSCGHFALAAEGEACSMPDCVGVFGVPDGEGLLPTPTRFRALELEVAQLASAFAAHVSRCRR